jgi:predicted metal-binding membrane protein
MGKGAVRVSGNELAWDHAGRAVAGATLIVAALYQLTPLKDVCLGKCRSPLGLLLGSWRDGRSGALQMGVKNGAWCLGCCWALMAILLVLGLMNLAWMAALSAVFLLEKNWSRGVALSRVVGLGLAVLGIAIILRPDLLATFSGDHGSMPTTDPMHMNSPALPGLEGA